MRRVSLQVLKVVFDAMTQLDLQALLSYVTCLLCLADNAPRAPEVVAAPFLLRRTALPEIRPRAVSSKSLVDSPQPDPVRWDAAAGINNMIS